MNLNENNTKAILARLDISALNEMQEAVALTAKGEGDLVLLSPTGSGKTIAFLLPLLNSLKNGPKHEVQALILTPSRELALQITKVFRSMKTGFKVNCCYGGHDLKTELNNLQDPPALLVGTPGRIADHLRRESFETKHIHSLVLDEFDKSLEFGFSKEMSFIIEALSSLKKRFLTSATAALEIPAFVGLNQAITLDFIAEKITSQLSIKGISCLVEEKENTLLALSQSVGHEPTLIFCNYRATVQELGDLFFIKGIVAEIFHGGLEQKEREVALIKFQNGSTNILITTDLAARGLDISTIRNIIHYQLPHSEEEFIHRNGRTARMNATGNAYILLPKEQPIKEYIDDNLVYEEIPTSIPKLDTPFWQTLYVSAGKKDKVNKFDLVGTFLKKGQLTKDELGLIVVKEHAAFVAVPRHKTEHLIKLLNKQRIKKKKILVQIAL